MTRTSTLKSGFKIGMISPFCVYESVNFVLVLWTGFYVSSESVSNTMSYHFVDSLINGLVPCSVDGI